MKIRNKISSSRCNSSLDQFWRGLCNPPTHYAYTVEGEKVKLMGRKIGEKKRGPRTKVNIIVKVFNIERERDELSMKMLCGSLVIVPDCRDSGPGFGSGVSHM